MKELKWAKFVSMICVILFVVSVLPSQISGQADTMKAGSVYNARFVLKFSTQELSFGTLNGYDLVNLNGCDLLNEVGKPQVPIRYIKIAVPAGIQIKNVYVESTQTTRLSGHYTLAPGQNALPLNVKDEDIRFVQPDVKAYASTQPYPSKVIEFVGETDLAGQPIGEFIVYPVHYIAGEKKLSLSTSITFIVTGVNGYTCGDYLPKTISTDGRATYETIVKDMVINPEAVRLQTENIGPESLTIPPGGPYSHVIITTNALSSYWAPLVDWHMKRGLRDTVVTTEYIYANYAGSTSQAKIRAFVIDAYNTWGCMYFLMAGEVTAVPLEYRTYLDESTPSDQYYSDFDDDWTHEVFVGRVTADTSTQIDTFIDKVLFYERTPPLTDYILKVLLVGMDADSSTHCSALKEVIDGYIPAQFIVTKVYDSDGGNHKTAVITALNAGQHLFNHADHGSFDYMGTGDYNHYWGLYNSDVDALTNNNKMTIVTSLSCDVNGFDYSDSISEHWVVYNPMQAGIAFNGNTRLGWYTVGNPQSLSGQLDRDWWRGLFQQSKYILGETIIWAKHQFSTTDNTRKHCEWEFSLLGEPAMPIWTDTPASFTVTHPVTLPIGSSTFAVHVTSGGNPVDQAYVCLWKGTEVYLTGNTNAAGDATFTPNPSTTGTMYVTVTKHNYLPYEGNATVTLQQPPSPPTTPIHVADGCHTHDYPNDMNKGIGKLPCYVQPPQGIIQTFSTNSTNTGEIYYKFFFGDGTDSGWLGPYTSSQVATTTHDYNNIGVFQVTAIAKVGTIESVPSPSLSVRMYKCGDINGDDLVDFGDINPFVLQLTSGKPAYYTEFPNGYWYTGDINNDCTIDFGDINPFVQELTSCPP